MAKNVLIFSDGTGQAGGITFDERRSNIYKLYRATRVGPDSTIKPSEQVAFYDPGLGSLADGGHMVTQLGRTIYNALSQATGLGITANIIDCYAALIRMWRPDDKIFLLGFSRGAYTVRCLASVIALCGIPTQQSPADPKLRKDFASSRRLAKEAVKGVYQYTHSSRPDLATDREKELMEQRSALARRFRDTYGSGDQKGPELANIYPHFIGVFDTVAAVAGAGSLTMVSIACLTLAFLAAVGLSYSASYFLWLPQATIADYFGGIVTFSVAAALAIFFLKSITYARGLPGHPVWKTIHIRQFKQSFEDLDLNEHVGYARHAISIDENRLDFARVPWGFRDQKHATADPSGVQWFEQYWFAGVHSDVGGGYLENEARLSDISFKWMVDEATRPEIGLKLDRTVLQLNPSHDGMQHDEVAHGFPIITPLTGYSWAKHYRDIPVHNTTVHKSVYERFTCGDVLQYDTERPYRPPTLRTHDDFKKYYTQQVLAALGPVIAEAAAAPPKAPQPTKEQNP